jgi:hypothetical protein
LPNGIGHVARPCVLEIDHDLLPIAPIAAAANVAAHQLANFIGGFRLSLRKEPRRRANLAWRAVPALKCIVIDKRLLQRM